MSKAQIISVFLFGSPLLSPEQNNDLFFHDKFLDFLRSILEFPRTIIEFPRVILEFPRVIFEFSRLILDFSQGLCRHNLDFHQLHL